jgi:long-chain acyl-CoA synthetase
MIKSCRFVNQVVLVGNSQKFPAALIVPSFEDLEQFARSEGLDLKTPKEFCGDSRVLELFETEIEKACQGLSKYERVKKVALLEQEFTVEGGELTPTLKVKRRIVNEKYSLIIERIYSDAEKRKP